MGDPVHIHLKLKQKLSNETDTESPEYENFCKQIEAKIGRGLAKRKKTPLDKLDALETGGLMAPGKYDTLRAIFENSGNSGFLSLIDEADAEIEAYRAPVRGATAVPARTSRAPAGGVTAVPPHTTGAESHPRASKRNYKGGAGNPVQETDGGANAGTFPCSSSSKDDSDPGTDEYYSIGEHQRGYLLILNSTENRTGTEFDVQQLVDFFRDDLKFEVDEPRSLEQHDFTKEELDNYLKDIKFRLNLKSAKKKFYCFICIILSHGDQKGIRTKGGDLKSVEEIRKMFNNRSIPNFTGRPKLFFVQACRGLDTQDGASYDDEEDDTSMVEDEDDAIVTIPVDADTLIAFSTTPGNTWITWFSLGYKSFRRTSGPVRGSWFIQELVNVFRSSHKTSHVEDMLVKVRGNVATNWTTGSGGKQMPCVWTTMTKKLKLR